MKKVLFTVMSAFLASACVVQSETYDQEIVSVPWKSELDESVDMPMHTSSTPAQTKTSEVTQGTQILTPSSSSKTPSYMDDQAKKLRQKLESSGVQIKQSDNEILLILPGHVVFGTNQTTIEPRFEPVLSSIARSINEYDRTKVQVFGYTDDTGSVAANHALSLRRANAVFNFLRLNGVDINRMVVDGLGPEKPIASNKTASGRKQNRRVEITLINIQ